MRFIVSFITLFSGLICSAQEVVFDSSGRAEAILVYEDETPEEVYNGLERYITRYYGTHEQTVKIDEINKTFTVNNIMYNALNRGRFPERTPNVSAEFQMDIALDGKTAKFLFQHKKFLDKDNITQYYIDFAKLYSNEKDILTFENEYNYYNKQFTALVNSIDHYLKTDTLIRAFGNNLKNEIYNKKLLQLDSNGIAEASLKHEGDVAALYGLSMNFANKYFFKPSIETDTIAKTITVHGMIYDVFSKRIYINVQKPLINTSFTIKLSFKENQINYTIQHTGFLDADWEPLPISYSGFINDTSPLKVTKEDMQFFIKSYNEFFSAFTYYLDKGEMAY